MLPDEDYHNCTLFRCIIKSAYHPSVGSVFSLAIGVAGASLSNSIQENGQANSILGLVAVTVGCILRLRGGVFRDGPEKQSGSIC